MDIEVEKVLLLLSGFISLKIYDLLIPNERPNFSKYFIEIVFYSVIHFLLFYKVIEFINEAEWHNAFQYLSFVLIFIIVPIFYPFLVVRIRNSSYMQRYFVHPIAKPWDYVFGKREPYWMIVHLRGGTRIGGRYDTNSFVSSFPAREQIYLEEVWQLDEKMNFHKKIDKTKGMLILGEDVLMIEFFSAINVDDSTRSK